MKFPMAPESRKAMRYFALSGFSSSMRTLTMIGGHGLEAVSVETTTSHSESISIIHGCIVDPFKGSVFVTMGACIGTSGGEVSTCL